MSSEGGNSAVWARSGRELFYLNGERMMAVSIGSGPEPAVGHPDLLFTGGYDFVGHEPNFDVTPDGQAFVMVRGDDGPDPWMQLNVTVNWFEELKRRAAR